jgi:hypothetical protein
MISRGLIIGSPYIDWILAGKKTWEIRGSYTHVQGKIALIRSGSGLVVGTCEVAMRSSLPHAVAQFADNASACSSTVRVAFSCLFGISLDGSTLRLDNDANEDLYGQRIKARDIVLGPGPQAPPAADRLITLLTQASPRPANG